MILKDILYFYLNALRIILLIYINIFYYIIPYSFHFSPLPLHHMRKQKR